MLYKVERLTANDYDELLSFLNEVFDYSKDKGFDLLLPVMWVRDDEHMGKHLVLRDNEKIVAALGIYPLKTNIMGEELLFATCGNIGTLESYRGKGLMSQLLDTAMDEMRKMGVDAARLGGQRQRYERYGFEPAGIKHTYRLDRKNIAEKTSAISFTPIESDSTEALSFAIKLQHSESQYVDRGNTLEFYKTASAWYNKPYLATDKDGKAVGILCTSNDKKEIAELYGLDTNVKYDILKAWIINNELSSVNYVGLGFDNELARLIIRDCAVVSVQHASQFKIMNWERVVNAVLKLKYRTSTPPDGSLSIKITDCGTLLYCDGRFTMTDLSDADVTLDCLTATRLIFGPLPPETVCIVPNKKSSLFNSLFPLPLSWNGQDRV